MEIEAELGDLSDVSVRLSTEPRATDCYGILSACIRAGSGDVVDRESLENGLMSIGLGACVTAASGLVASYFVHGKHARPAKDDEKSKRLAPDEPGYPAQSMVSQAVAVWGVSIDEAWTWTAPDWWAVFDAYMASRDLVDETVDENGKTEMQRLAEELNADKRRERAGNLVVLRARERMNDEQREDAANDCD